MLRTIFSLFFPTVFAASEAEIRDYLLSNPTTDPDFQQGIINVGLPTVNSGGVANSKGEILLKDGVLAGQSVIGFVILTMLKLIGAFALVGVGVNLFTLIFSAGSSDKIKKAKSGILFSLAGLVIALLAHAAVTALVQYFLKV